MTLKAAVVGTGPHGQRLIDVINQIPKLKLSAIIDRSKSALNSCKVSDETKRFSDIKNIADDNIDLVCIATNGPSHAELALTAMDCGAQYILVEKPMACSVDECAQMVNKAQEKGVRLAVDHPRHFCADYIWLREMIKTGKWGKPKSIWIQRPGIGLGCLATHSFDLARFIFDLDVERVTSWVDKPVKRNPRGEEFVDPGGLVVLEMTEGVKAIVNQIEDGAGPMSVEIDLTAARIRFDEKLGILEVIERDLSVAPGPNRPPAYQILENPSGIPGKRNLKVEIIKLIEELIGEGSISAAGSDGLVSIEILIAAYLSQQKGNIPIPLPLTSSEDRSFWVPVT